MIDFHSHILPSVDDGSKSIEESNEMLLMLSMQGVDTVVATPHFLPDRESAEEFIQRRQVAYDELMRTVGGNTPKILLGAEVAYYEGISRLKEIQNLKAGNSKLLLLEMPVCKWSEAAVNEMIQLSCSGNLTLVLAHIERYFPYQNKAVFKRLLECGVLFQVNASFFNDFRTRRKALSMLKNCRIHFIGSDCHNLTHRPPRIGQAFDIIRKKLGDDFLQDFTEFQRNMIFS